MRFYCVLIILITSFFCYAEGNLIQKEATLDEIVQQLDLIYRSKSIIGKMEMQIETPHWKRTLKMDMWGEGLKKTLVVIKSPRKDRGITTLRVKQEMWNYFPKIRKVMKVPPSMMMGGWMGSDFTNDDLVKETSLLEDYSAEKLKSDDSNYYMIQLIPKKDTASVWGKIISKVERKRMIPLTQEYYDEKGQKMREIQFKNIKTFGDKTIPATMVLIPINKKGHKTTVTYKEVTFDKKLKKGTFSLRNLKKKR